MSSPTIAECYDDILEDHSLLQLFLEKEWQSIQKLPLLGALQFRIISERLFACIVSPTMWGKARMKFITNNGPKKWGSHPNVILVTDGVGEGNLGMVTTFCCHDQSKMEASNALSALHQCNSPEPRVVVVRRYTNTPYIPQGSSLLLYLYVSTLSRDASSAVPLHYISGALATTVQQDEDVPATITASKPEGSLAPGPSSSPTHPPGTLPLPVPPLPNISFVGTPLVRCPFAEFFAIPTQKK